VEVHPTKQTDRNHFSLHTISDEWLHHLSVTLPVLLLIAYPQGGIHLAPMLHHSLLGLLTAHAFLIVPTDLLKIWIGKLRPDFFSCCAYSEDSNICKLFFHNHKLMEHSQKMLG
jgi:hypothetical protein